MSFSPIRWPPSASGSTFHEVLPAAMAIAAGRGRLITALALFLASSFADARVAASDARPGLFGGGFGDPGEYILGGESSAPWATGILKFSPPPAPGPTALPPDAKYPLVLAKKRTRRPDILNKFKLYRGGWDITNKHYWASVGFTGFTGFVLSSIWFISFAIAMGARHCCRCGIGMKKKYSSCLKRTCLILLLVFTCAVLIGCILLSVGQDKFHDEVLDTLNFVVNQSDFTVQILRNVSDYLSLAKAINVGQLYLPSGVQKKIDSLNTDLINAAGTLSGETAQNSRRIRQVFYDIRCALIAVAAVMLCLAVLGFLLSISGHRHAIYIFILSGWLLVAVTFLLFGGFGIINNFAGDTCTAMDEWVHNAQAETALSNILPCVDERTTNLTLYRSKEVVLQLVNIVNTAIFSISNSNHASEDKAVFYNQSGPLLPPLCSPYDSRLHNRQCGPREVSFINASMVWQNYTCVVSDSGVCISVGRLTPTMYNQLAEAINVSYALDHYTPFLLDLQNCNFVRETFDSITTQYCPRLELNLRMINAGLALISAGVMLCLILWLLFANCSKELSAKLSDSKASAVDKSPPRMEL